jgi:excisionase family DNA binding protein
MPTEEDDPNRIYTFKEAFKYLKDRKAPIKNEQSLYQLVHDRKIGRFRMGRELRFRKYHLDDYLRSITGDDIPPFSPDRI